MSGNNNNNGRRCLLSFGLYLSANNNGEMFTLRPPTTACLGANRLTNENLPPEPKPKPAHTHTQSGPEMVHRAQRHQHRQGQLGQHRLHGQRLPAAQNHLDQGERRPSGGLLGHLHGRQTSRAGQTGPPPGRLGEFRATLGTFLHPITKKLTRRNLQRSIVSSPHLQVFENGSLNILDARDSDLGHYMCQASNGVGAGLSKVIRLVINGKCVDFLSRPVVVFGAFNVDWSLEQASYHFQGRTIGGRNLTMLFVQVNSDTIDSLHKRH